MDECSPNELSPSSGDSAREVFESTINEWVDDPESDVVYAEWVEDRWAVRMRQQVREATTVWFWVGDRSLIAEAYVVPSPQQGEAVYRQALVRNRRSFRAYFALDEEGAVVLRARLPVDRVNQEELSYLLAEIYEAVESAFPPMLRAGSERENRL